VAALVKFFRKNLTNALKSPNPRQLITNGRTLHGHVLAGLQTNAKLKTSA
jgi:hypothetical protein